MFTLGFWNATAERAVKTFCQAAVAFLVAAGTGLLDTDWEQAVSVSLMAAILSVLTSVGSAGTNGGSPSLTGAETLPKQ